MSRTDFLNNIGSEIHYKNPQDRFLSVVVDKDDIDHLLSLQEAGWTFFKPLKRIGGECEACSA